MPIYEYQCESCGAIVEKWQKITDAPITTCEACGGKLKKLISMSSFHLKGSGWYVTDYASKGHGSSTKEKGSSNKDASSTSSTSTDKTGKKKD